MSSVFWLFLFGLIAPGRAFLSCKPDCNVRTNLNCSVQFGGRYCLSTALSSGPMWPGKPEGLTIEQYPTGEADSRGEVGMNISWRTPHDASASHVSGFEVTLMLIGSHVNGIQSCFVFNLTSNADRSSGTSFSRLVESVFTLQCRVPATAEGVFTKLFSLPKPENNLSLKSVSKYVKITKMATVMPLNPCDIDLQIDAKVFQSQLIVKLRNWSNGSKYVISLMKGAYEYARKIIQPGNSTGQEGAIFEDPDVIRHGECYSIWAQLESCGKYWAIYKDKPLCINTTKPSTPSTNTDGVSECISLRRQVDCCNGTLTAKCGWCAKGSEGPACYSYMDVKCAGKEANRCIERSTLPSGLEMPEKTDLSPTAIAVLAVIVVLILCLTATAAYRWMKCTYSPESSVVPYTSHIHLPHSPGPDQDVTAPLTANIHLPHSAEDVKELVLLYCVSPANRNCVQEFRLLLKNILQDVKVTDFMDDREVERSASAWIRQMKAKVNAPGGRLLVILSSGITYLLKADTDGKYYPNYGEKEHNGEYVVNFFKKLNEDLMYFDIETCKECVVSLGSEYTESSKHLYKFLAKFSGWRPKLFSLSKNGGVSVDKNNMTSFLKWLGVTEPMAVLKRLETDVALKQAVAKMLREENDPHWFQEKYGEPLIKGLADPGNDKDTKIETPDTESNESDSDDLSQQEGTSSGFYTGEPNTALYLANEPVYPSNNGSFLENQEYLNNGEYLVNQQGYPLKNGEYPVNRQGYPLNNVEYPVNRQGYPLNNGEYPVNQQGYPLNNGEYPVNQQGYPLNNGEYPVNPQGYPLNNGEYPVNQQGYPLNNGEYPVNQQGYPLNNGEYPVNPQGYPLNNGEYPVNPQGYPLNNGEYPVNPHGYPLNNGEYPVNPQGYPLNYDEYLDNKRYQECPKGQQFIPPKDIPDTESE